MPTRRPVGAHPQKLTQEPPSRIRHPHQSPKNPPQPAQLANLEAKGPDMGVDGAAVAAASGHSPFDLPIPVALPPRRRRRLLPPLLPDHDPRGRPPLTRPRHLEPRKARHRRAPLLGTVPGMGTRPDDMAQPDHRPRPPRSAPIFSFISDFPSAKSPPSSAPASTTSGSSAARPLVPHPAPREATSDQTGHAATRRTAQPPNNSATATSNSAGGWQRIAAERRLRKADSPSHRTQRWHHQPARRTPTETANHRQWLQSQYVVRKRTLPDIAAELGVSATTVGRAARTLGVPVRSRVATATPAGGVPLCWPHHAGSNWPTRSRTVTEAKSAHPVGSR